MSEVKAAFKAALMSIPEGSTCYWLVKKENQYGQPQKVGKLSADSETDIYEEIVLKYGPGIYLVWLFDNNEQKQIKVPIRFVVPGEAYDDEEDEEQITKEANHEEILQKAKNKFASALQYELELEEINSMRERLNGKKNSVNQENNLARIVENLERKAEEREKRFEEKIKEMQQNQQQNGIFALVAEMQKSGMEMTKLMLSQQSDNQKLVIALLNKKDNEKNFWDSPFFIEVYKKATQEKKSIFDDSMAKMMDMFFTTQQQTMQRMVDMQYEVGQNDVFFQRMKMFKDMAAQVGPGLKDFAIKMASIKAAKETEQEKIRAKTQAPQQQAPQQQAPQQQAPQQQAPQQQAPQQQAPQQQAPQQQAPQQQAPQQQAPQQQAPQQQAPKIVVIKQNKPETKNYDELQQFFLSIYNRFMNEDDIQDIEKEIRNKNGAIEEIKTNPDLKEFVDSQGGAMKELFDKIRGGSEIE